MKYDAIQILVLIATYVVPVLIGAGCQDFTKAVAITASAVFLGNLLYTTLFDGWSGFSTLESRMLASAATVPLSVPLGAAGFGLRRLVRSLGRLLGPTPARTGPPARRAALSVRPGPAR